MIFRLFSEPWIQCYNRNEVKNTNLAIESLQVYELHLDRIDKIL